MTGNIVFGNKVHKSARQNRSIKKFSRARAYILSSPVLQGHRGDTARTVASQTPPDFSFCMPRLAHRKAHSGEFAYL